MSRSARAWTRPDSWASHLVFLALLALGVSLFLVGALLSLKGSFVGGILLSLFGALLSVGALLFPLVPLRVEELRTLPPKGEREGTEDDQR